MEAAEEILLDVNAMAAGKDYFSVGDYAISQDNQLIAWAEDAVGRRQYTVRFRDIASGATFPDEIGGVAANLVWADDNRTLFYIENDPETLLTVRVKKHVLGTPASAGRRRVRGRRRQFLPRHRPQPRRPLHLHFDGKHGVQRTAPCARGRSAALHGAGAARARRRIPGRPPAATAG